MIVFRPCMFRACRFPQKSSSFLRRAYLLTEKHPCFKHNTFCCSMKQKRPTWRMTHEKKCHNYEKRKKHIETKLPPLWNHHKIGFVGIRVCIVCVDACSFEYKYIRSVKLCTYLYGDMPNI